MRGVPLRVSLVGAVACVRATACELGFNRWRKKRLNALYDRDLKMMAENH